MALIDTLKHLKIDQLTDEERADLKKLLESHRRELQSAIRALDRELKRLEKRPRGKRPAKRD
jgi:hypothetical protein